MSWAGTCVALYRHRPAGAYKPSRALATMLSARRRAGFYRVDEHAV